MLMPRFDSEKAIEAIVYITGRVPPGKSSIYTVVKLLYFADKLHLHSYGRLITGDQYVAMRNGPVPSNAYDIVKSVRGDDGMCIDISHAEHSFAFVAPHWLKPLRSPDTDLFSESEIECLDAVIAEDGSKSFGQLKDKSHDAAFDEADENDFMTLESIIKSLPNSESIIEHLSDPFPG